MKIELISINKIKNNPSNPRVIKDSNFKKLVKSIQEFPEMLEIRPTVVDSEMMVLGGNQRLKACKEAGLKEIPIIKADELTEEQQKEFIVKDNSNYGDWDFDLLTEQFDADLLDDWAVDLPDEKEKTETEKLSDLSFEDIYYEPKEIPNIELSSCVDLDLFNSKLDYIMESNLDDKIKNILKFFAYRFIKIDFEMVANYYAFNASEEEKKVIERLRLVLVDNSIRGFIQDDLLRVNDMIKFDLDLDDEND